jgi:hypothetical protein
VIKEVHGLLPVFHRNALVDSVETLRVSWVHV